ncbi:hypothetical protein QE152_g17033 [Popillia japonica]|uniref:Uncharacterized protein n=1 Tax=Popillia japonica TaxID=7064 RepID=A0AAW1L5P3_POPJA
MSQFGQNHAEEMLDGCLMLTKPNLLNLQGQENQNFGQTGLLIMSIMGANLFCQGQENQNFGQTGLLIMSIMGANLFCGLEVVHSDLDHIYYCCISMRRLRTTDFPSIIYLEEQNP